MLEAIYWNEIIPMIKDVIIALAAIITALLAVYGVTSWKRELSGRTEYETARNILRATYKLRDAIWSFRSPLILSIEFPEGYMGVVGKHSNKEEAEAYSHVYSHRWKPLEEAVREFQVASLESEVLWGESMKEKTDQFIGFVNSLYLSFESKIRYTQSGDEDRLSAFYQKISQDLSATRESEDELSNEIRKTISSIEEAVKPHMKRKG